MIVHFYILIIYAASICYLKKGGIFIHASCVEKNHQLYIFPGWRHSGKTHLSLEFAKSGFNLVSDDGIWIDKKANVHPVSKKIHLLYYNFIMINELQKLL